MPEESGKSQEDEINALYGLPAVNKDGSRQSNYNDDDDCFEALPEDTVEAIGSSIVAIRGLLSAQSTL
ncbi:Alpha-ketoglutarate-dependent taurine dioxygenase [Penicillium sp. IBT 16267x]|nr:Alpha-ketoglutarate-dependent taurine dioxygenase [Penicillium sp. IBT 16267x]